MRNTSMMAVVLVALGAGGMAAQQGTRTPNMKVTAEASPAVQTKIRQAMQAAPPEISGARRLWTGPRTRGRR